MTKQAIPDSGVRCPVCRTHLRPLYVPWDQHAIGCSVRSAELTRDRDLRLRLWVIARTA